MGVTLAQQLLVTLLLWSQHDALSSYYHIKITWAKCCNCCFKGVLCFDRPGSCTKPLWLLGLLLL